MNLEHNSNTVTKELLTEMLSAYVQYPGYFSMFFVTVLTKVECGLPQPAFSLSQTNVVNVFETSHCRLECHKIPMLTNICLSQSCGSIDPSSVQNK